MNQILEKIKKWLFVRFVGYYSQGHYKFVLDGSNLLLKRSEKQVGIITIYDKQYYSETVNKIPVKEASAVKKVLETQRKMSLPKVSFYSVGSDNTDFTYYNSWVFREEVSRSWIMLPESYVLAKTLEPLEVALDSTRNYFCAQGLGLTYSGYKTPLVNSSERFAHAVGIASDKHKEIATEQQKVQLLFNGINKSLLTLVKHFFNVSFFKTYKAQAQRTASVCALIFVTYSLLSSAYIYINMLNVESTLESKRSEVDNALDTFNMLDTKLAKLNAQKGIFINTPIVSPYFFAIEPLSKIAHLNSVELSNERFVVRGDASNALSALEALKSVERVSDARFDFPVRKNREREQFVISFVLDLAVDRVKIEGETDEK